MRLSIVISAFNEAETIVPSLRRLQAMRAHGHEARARGGWFLHADSLITSDTAEVLLAALADQAGKWVALMCAFPAFRCPGRKILRGSEIDRTCGVLATATAESAGTAT